MVKDGVEYWYNYIYLKQDNDKNHEIWRDFGDRKKMNVSCKSINIDVAKPKFKADTEIEIHFIKAG